MRYTQAMAIEALDFLQEGIPDGEHHKMWIIDQTVRILTGCDEEPVTIEKLREAMKELGLPETFRANAETDLVRHMSLKDAGEYLMPKLTGPVGEPQKTIGGIEVKTDGSIPVDVLTYWQADKLVKIIPLTEEAEPVAKMYAFMYERGMQYVGLF